MAENIIRQMTRDELERLQGETAINRSEVNKVSPNSVLSGLLAGNATVASKSMKDIALAVSQLLPSLATGTALDRAARDYGIPARFGATQSSVTVRLRANSGTVYTQGSIIRGNGGEIFELESDITVDDSGIAYGKAKSQDAGEFTSVSAYTLTSISPIPLGHIAITNEYRSSGGRDQESDDSFRQRILKGANIAAVGTLEKYTQIFRQVNSDVLKTFFHGHNSEGKIRLGVASENGKSFTQNELDAMAQNVNQYLTLNEMSPTGTESYGIVLENIEYHYIDIDFRVQLYQNADVINVINNIQVKFAKSVDFRFWKLGIDKIEWERLLSIVQSERGVKYASDVHFTPGNDITIPKNKLPMFRSFIMRDLNGNIIQDDSGTIAPVFYPGETLVNFSQTVLQ